MRDYAKIVASLRELAEDENDEAARAADAIELLRHDLKDCRNELCLKCGYYKERHKGACDGCRWLDEPSKEESK